MPDPPDYAYNRPTQARNHLLADSVDQGNGSYASSTASSEFRRKVTRTVLLSRSLGISGWESLNAGIARRIIGHPPLRRSIRPATTMAWAIDSLRERSLLPARTLSTFMRLGNAPGLVTDTRSSKTSSSSGDPVIA